MRDHKPIILEEFNGLWKRGDADSVPQDHFSEAINIQFIQGGFETRDGLDTYIAKGDVVRLYNYIMQTGESLLVLDTNGDIWHCINEVTIYGPILSIPEMTDFGFTAIAGRAYITPFATFLDDNGIKYQKGLENEFTYVYKGDGTAARKAAGNPPTNSDLKPFVCFNSSQIGLIDAGVHVIAVSVDGGPLGPTIFPVVQAPGGFQIQLTNIPIVAGADRTIVMTKAIDPKDYVADQTTYTYYEVLLITDDTLESALISIDDASMVSVFSPGAGIAPTNLALQVENTEVLGFADFGFRLFAVVYETDTGYLSAPGPEFFGANSSVNIKTSIKISNIPISPDSFVTKRHIVATKVITGYTGNQTGYQFFFVPEGTLENNTDNEITVDFYDQDLLDDASHLLDNFSEIPAMVGLTTYHGRMVGWASFEDISVGRISAPGEPEAISQVDGLVILELDGKPITNAQQFRDVLYFFKQTRTVSANDNGDVPASWPLVVIDQGIGASVHGVATVLDSGGVNIDFLFIVDFSGIMMFDGFYKRPELTWKIKDFWFALDQNEFDKIQILNDSLNMILYMLLTDSTILIGDYSNALSPKDIRWAIWNFDIDPTSITLINVDTLILGAVGVYVPPVDFPIPVIESFLRDMSTPINAPTVAWSLKFSVPVTGVTLNNFTLITTGLTGSPALLSVTGSGKAYTVTASTGQGNGTLQVRLSSYAGIVSTNGKPLQSVGNSEIYVIERSAPVVNSITRVGSVIQSGDSSLVWLVTFSQPVFNVDTGDFQLAPISLTGSAIVSVAGSGSSYTVTANSGTGDGSIGLNLVNNGSITNAQTIALTSGFTGEIYTVQAFPTAPSALIFTFVSTSAISIAWTDNATNETSFEIERQVGFGAFLAIGSVGANVTTYTDNTVTPNTLYTYRVRAVNAICSSAYVTSAQISTPSDALNPTITSINRASTNPTNATSVDYLVSFSEPVTGVTLGAFTLITSGVTGTPEVSIVNPSAGNSYLVSVATGSGGAGTIQMSLSVIAGIVSASSGLPLLTPFDGQIYTIDRVLPTALSINRTSSNPTITGATVTWTIVFSEVVTGVAISNFALVGVSGSIIGLSGSGTTYLVTALIGSTNGSLGLNLVP